MAQNSFGPPLGGSYSKSQARVNLIVVMMRINFRQDMLDENVKLSFKVIHPIKAHCQND